MEKSGKSNFTLENILNNQNYTEKHVKVVCTIGPACNNVETLVKMIDNGMNIARLNFSHGDHEVSLNFRSSFSALRLTFQTHKATVQILKEALRQRKHKPVAILLDTKGPEIRTGFYKDTKTIKLVKGQDLELTTDYDFKGDNTKFACKLITRDLNLIFRLLP